MTRNIILVMATILGLTEVSKADFTVNTLWKYGVNGYKTSGNNTSTSSTQQTAKNKFTSSSNSVNNETVQSTSQLVPGLGFEVSTRNDGPVVGLGYYLDNTIQMNLGWKIF